MPVTPFHIGPGLIIKAVLQGSFSLMIFGWSQIIIDIQPLIVLMTGRGSLHGLTHTFIGASFLAVIAALTGKSISEWFLRRLELPQIRFSTSISWPVAFISAFLGTFIHIILDSVMHSDMEPFYPVISGNHLHGAVAVSVLHKLCLVAGVIGCIVYVIVNKYILAKKNVTIID